MTFSPQINVLNQDHISDIHSKSLHILEKAGIRVDCEDALEIFKRSTYVKTEGKLVYIMPELVEKSIASAPSSIKIYNKQGEEAFVIGNTGSSKARFGVGVTNSNFQDPVTGKIVQFRREHTRYATKLGDMLESYDMISTPGVPMDVPPQKLDLFNLADMYANTDKPLVILLLADGIMAKAMEFIKLIHGDPGSRPFIMPYVNPVTPLILNKSTTDKMKVSIENGLPLIFSNYGMSGGTSPIDGAGTLTLL
ncbi:MAG: trimethylamine methyltransferase family protein, partial [Bacteroidales bacterium]|nr:trimethylamine methyltransferase family protein [Bacteroidales bacterium]